MAKKKQKNKLSTGSIMVIVVGIIVVLFMTFTFINFQMNENREAYKNADTEEVLQDKELWDSLDNFDDFNFDCGLKVANYIVSQDYENANSQVKKCKEEASSILVKTNTAHRENPTRETEVAKMDIQQSYHIYVIYETLIGMSLGDYATAEQLIYVLKQDLVSLDKAINIGERINVEYNDTKFYQRYHLPRIREIEENNRELLLLREDLEKRLEELEKGE